MIPKKEFRELRKRILAALQRRQDQNGYNHLSHDSLNSPLTYGMDLQPFKGMQGTIRATAISRFWDALVRAKQVVKVEYKFDGHDYCEYHLPGTPRLPGDAPDPASLAPEEFREACLEQFSKVMEKLDDVGRNPNS
jgi:hypothetical protein